MSDRVVQSVNETSGVQPMQTYQSVWMSHWLRASCKATAETLNLASSVSGNEELSYGIRGDNLRHGFDVLTSGKEPAVTETKTSEMINYSTKMGTERFGFGSSIFEHSRKTDDVQVQRAVIDRSFERGKDVDVNRGTQFPSMLRGFPYASDTSSRRFHHPDEGTSKNPLEWMKNLSSAEESSSVALKPLQETFAEPSSLCVLYKHDLGKYGSHRGKSEISSLIGGDDMVCKNQFQNTHRRVQEHISCNKHSQSADLVCQGKHDSLPQLENFMNECFRENNASLFLDVPSTSGNRLPTFNQEWFQKMQKCSGLRPYPDHFMVSEETEAKKSYYNCYSLHKLPNCLHNVETMRLCTTMEEENLEGFPRFSQTSRSLLIKKTTDFNLSSEFDIFDATRVITEVNGNTAGQSKREVILQPLSNSAESERKGYVGDVETHTATLNNESSAETDTMDMDHFKENNPYSGANSTPSDKAFNMNSFLSYPIDVFSSRETETRGPKTKLPDINLELPALAAAKAASSENSGPSSSKTQSLEMDMLMAHAEPSKPNSNLSLEDSREADPGNRWVKRLKLSSSQSSSRGMNSSNPTENSHDKKMKKYFGRILTTGIPSSEPYSRKHHGKESMVLDNKGTLSKQNTEIRVSSIKKNSELLLSQPWIQRWRHGESRSSREYTERMAVCALQSSKLTLEDHHKKQFPSIGAMALMGKAMRGFQPCDLQKRGSFTVWNTKTI
ncbi:uncharacterized protein [Primulina huaijiensis]|uniref:uncharacterized protein isoform X2 n=1 Tax=Primulina huaijiensis TaxID=1492673 RepID=UPI003CC70FE8